MQMYWSIALLDQELT